MLRARLIACVLLPFAAGYYLSYLFRTINALIARDLTAELGLNAADLGLLTSVYFLVFAVVQLPLGALLDRHGPGMIQSFLLLLASAGSLVFALADGLFGLVIGRALLSLGVAGALMSGFKAIVLWFPPSRNALTNGWLVMLGALGAVTATAPAELVVQALGWRGLFALLAGLSTLAALLVLFAVPEPTGTRAVPTGVKRVSLWAIYRDRRFWRIAPLSSVGIGTSWSLQGLWAAPWLRDVNGLDRADVVQHLGVMAIAVCLSALLLGTATDRLRRRGTKTESVLASVLALSMAAQTALVCAWPFPSHLLWAMIAAAGAATVLSFAILTEYFPKEMSARANAALNLLHVGGAFVLQSATGLVIEHWPATSGSYPVAAHQTAMAASITLQLAAFAWFALPARSQPGSAMQGLVMRAATSRRPQQASAPIRYATVLGSEQSRTARRHATGWRFAAAASAALCVALATALASTIVHANLAAHIVEVDRSIVCADGSTLRDAITPTTAEAAPLSGLASPREVPAQRSAHPSAAHLTVYGLSSSSPAEFARIGPTPEPRRFKWTEQQRDERRFLYVDESSQPRPRGLSGAVGREASLRRHRPSRTHQQRGVRRMPSERAHGAAVRSRACSAPAEYSVRHRQARARVPRRDVLARRGRDWHAGGADRLLLRSAGAGPLCGRAPRGTTDSTVVLMDGTIRRSMPLPPQTLQAPKGLARPDQGRMRAPAVLSLRASPLRAVAKRAMKLLVVAA